MIPDWVGVVQDAGHQSLDGSLWRIVESQEQIATMALVDDLDEQSLLEEMLNENKPPLDPSVSGIHYLLTTPFRYPPLSWGSRFGSVSEPSLFYGSLDLSTLAAEAAYYRLVFWNGMENPPESKFRTQHTVFSISFMTEKGIDLSGDPFTEYQQAIIDPVAYGPTQVLGAVMREEGIELVYYPSARAPEKGMNVALFAPKPFQENAPSKMIPWVCETDGDEVLFRGDDSLNVRHYPVSTFLVDGQLPQPA